MTGPSGPSAALPPALAPWRHALSAASGARVRAQGQAETLARLITGAPDVIASSVDWAADRIRVGRQTDVAADTRQQLTRVLKGLRPWRKGPFRIMGIDVDAEWRSDWKWRRVHPHIAPLRGRRVLDVGMSSGYYMMRMLADQPELVVGIDPFPAYYWQFRLLQSFHRDSRLCGLPIGLEDLPEMTHFFDTVFLMGILYHSRRPLDVLTRMHRLLSPGGQLVVESLVLEDAGETELRPPGRYAKMRNVYAIPSVPRLKAWLAAAGFENARCLDISRTLPAEQRRTPWMPFESLSDFLDPSDPGCTVEGHPAPIRAVVIAETRRPSGGAAPDHQMKKETL